MHFDWYSKNNTNKISWSVDFTCSKPDDFVIFRKVTHQCMNMTNEYKTHLFRPPKNHLLKFIELEWQIN